jgi:hypothetical protein
MAHANAVTGATVYVDDGTGGMAGIPAPDGSGSNPVVVPEDTFTPDGWPGAVRFTGPGDTFGSGVVIDIDSDA